MIGIKMVNRKEARQVAMLALCHSLLIGIQKSMQEKSRGWNKIAAMLELLDEADKTIKGCVSDEYIELTDRFLCMAQAAIDGFWEEMDELDRGFVEEIHKRHQN